MEFGMNLDTKDKKLAKTIAEEYSENVKSKAYLAFLGVCAFKEYLKDCDINAEKDSLAKIKKIYETTDIADVFANGVCVDVRTYTSSDALYVPKKHFENNLLPKYYVLAIYDEQASQVIFKGYTATENIDKSVQTAENYVVEQTKLAPMEDLIQEIYNAKIKEQNINTQELSGFFAALLDGQIEKEQELQIIKLLYSSAEGRKDIVEFSEFEFLANNLTNFPDLFEQASEEQTENAALTEENEEQVFEEDEDFDFEGIPDSLPDDFENELNSLEDLAETEENSADSEKDVQDSSVLQTLAQAGTAGAAFAAGAVAGAAAADTMNNMEDLVLDLASGVAETAENIYENVCDEVSENSDTLEDISSAQDNLEENYSEENSDEILQESEETEEDIFTDLGDNEDDNLFDIDDDFETDGSSLNADNEEIPDLSETTEEISDFEENQLTDEKEHEFNFDDNEADMLSLDDEEPSEDDLLVVDSDNENDIQEDSIEDEETSEDIFFENNDDSSESIDDFSDVSLEENQNYNETNLDEEIIVEDNTDDGIFDSDFEEISETDVSEPEIVETANFEQEDSEPENEIAQSDNENTQNEYDYSDLNSVLEEIQAGQTEKIEETEENQQNYIEEEPSESEDINLQTLFEDVPSEPEEQNLLNEEEYTKYVQEPSSKPVKNLVVPVVGVVAAAVLAGGGIFTLHKISNKFSFDSQRPATEVQMKSVDDFDDETFLEKGEAELLAKEKAADNIGPNPDAIEASDLNQSISNIFDETVYPVMVSKIAWEIPEFYTTSKYFKKYLQIAGVQLQRDLQTNLANVNGVSETGKIKLSFDVDENSSIKNLKVLETSGSKEIDEIVAKSVRNTISYIKVPVIPSSENFVTLTLVINF